MTPSSSYHFYCAQGGGAWDASQWQNHHSFIQYLPSIQLFNNQIM